MKTMKQKKLLLTIAAFFAVVLLPATTRADNLSVTFTPSSYNASAGSVVTLFATFNNGAGAINFLGYQENLQSGLSLSPDNNFGSQPFDSLTSLSSNGSLGPVAVFNILIAPGTPNGTVFTFASNQFLFFYETAAGGEATAAANFSITVQNGAVPEPASM